MLIIFHFQIYFIIIIFKFTKSDEYTYHPNELDELTKVNNDNITNFNIGFSINVIYYFNIKIQYKGIIKTNKNRFLLKENKNKSINN